jgi:hypothetical protein
VPAITTVASAFSKYILLHPRWFHLLLWLLSLSDRSQFCNWIWQPDIWKIWRH